MEPPRATSRCSHDERIAPRKPNGDDSGAAGDGEHDETPQASLKPDQNRVVRHIMVIGFHHKHGYQVDYCYPPLAPAGPTFSSPGHPISLPASWKTLPLLCLPDGSHKHDSDTIYFTMPDVAGELGQDSNESDTKKPFASDDQHHHRGIRTIFGTACYRQIHVEKLVNRTDDMTRIAVQKSVCVLSTQPLFGLIRSKLEMITHAYFEELDFSKVRILKMTYDNLNSLLSRESVRLNATFLGLSTRHLVAQFGNNVLVLYKAMLLEKKILFYKSPVRDLCSTIMSMCSLFNGLLECGGLDHSTCDLQLSPTLLEALKLEVKSPLDHDSEEARPREGRVFFSPAREQVVILERENEADDGDGLASNALAQAENDLKRMLTNDDYEVINRSGDVANDCCASNERTRNKTTPDVMNSEADAEFNADLLDGAIIDDQYAHRLSQMDPEDCGFPLQIFTRGSFCLPYLSISYLDLLSDSRVRSFVIGATNFLFKQRREMYDVIVDMEENTIIIPDTKLKQALSLTIEDLRFMDYLQRHVNSSSGSTGTISSAESAFDPINHDTTSWLGGDEWIRYYFKIYTLYLLKAAKSSFNLETFNAHFVRAWKLQTNNYRIWDATGKAAMLAELQARHPFSSATRGINFSDMKLKLSYAVNSSDKGRMVNQTLNGIGKWSIWNNIASAGSLAANTVSTLATSASTAVNNPASNSDRQHSSGSPAGRRPQQAGQEATRKQ